MKKIAFFASLACFLAGTASAAVVAYTWEENGNIRTEYSGSLDLSGITYAQGRTQVNYATFRGNTTRYFNMFDYKGYWDATMTTSGPGAAGPLSVSSSTTTFNHTRYGDQFGYGVTSGNQRGTAVYAAYDYINGSAISGGSTLFGKTFGDIGLFGPATVNVSWSSDSITHYFGQAPSEVPLPAGFPLVATGLGVFAFLRRKKKKA